MRVVVGFRVTVLLCFLVVLGVLLLVFSISRTVSFFVFPSQEELIRGGGVLKVAGEVCVGSVEEEGAWVIFEIKDSRTRLRVRYGGLLPSLFREGQLVVVKGRWVSSAGVFVAERVLAKHDETYRPLSEPLLPFYLKSFYVVI